MSRLAPSRPAARARLAAVVGAGLAVCATVGAPAADATPGLVADTNVSGYLGFCDAAHAQVRSGLTAAAPFAWTTVASVPAPAGYELGRATVIAYQPRAGVDAMDWSGKQLNAASIFADPSRPAAEGTRIDSSFSDFTGTYTPKVDGLVQLRMIFTAVNKPAYAGAYPAVMVRIKGDRWTQVGGGPVNCAAGKARSVEYDTLPAARLKVRAGRPTPPSAAQLKALAKAGPTSGDRGGAGAGSAGRSAGAAAASRAGANGTAAGDAADASPAAADRSTGDGGSGTAWLWFAAVGVVIAAGVGFATRRRWTGRTR